MPKLFYGNERKRQKLFADELGVVVKVTFPSESLEAVDCCTQLIGGVRLEARSSA